MRGNRGPPTGVPPPNSRNDVPYPNRHTQYAPKQQQQGPSNEDVLTHLQSLEQKIDQYMEHYKQAMRVQESMNTKKQPENSQTQKTQNSNQKTAKDVHFISGDAMEPQMFVDDQHLNG